MHVLGTFTIWLAAAVAAYSLLVLMQGLRRGKHGIALIDRGLNAALLTAVLFSAATVMLLYSLAVSNFRIEYVASYTSRELPFFYKLTAFYAGQKGSLLLWGWLLTLFTAAFVLVYRRRQYNLLPHVTAVMMGVTLFFGALLVLVAPPFEQLHHAPANGAGLNPLLQHPLMVIHPPLLYVGYVGFTVPFAFAIAALLAGRYEEDWVRRVRRWTLLPWLFLTLGIVIGAQWAYVELGWGGYWAWDPVENASLMPWLTGTAFLHTIIVQEKKGMLRRWSLALIMLTFLLCIFGTFITRSGIIESVHAFGKSHIGTMFGAFLALSVAFCAWLLFRRAPQFRSSERVESLLSRESAGVFNNLIFMAALLAVLWGTIFPLVSEVFQGQQGNLGVAYYNKVTLPIALVLLALTGIGPLLAWRSTPATMLRRQFTWPLAIAVLGGALLWIFEIRHLYAFVALVLAIFVVATIVQDFIRSVAARVQHHSEQWWVALLQLFTRNQRRYAGHLVHFGVVLIFIGIAGSAFNQEKEVVVTTGQSFQLGDYDLQFVEADVHHEKTMHRLIASVRIFKHDAYVSTLLPEKRLYFTHEQPMTEVAMLSTLREDVYLVLAGYDLNTKTASFQAHVNPLVTWIWIGGWLMAFATIFAIVPFGSGHAPVSAKRVPQMQQRRNGRHARRPESKPQRQQRLPKLQAT